MNIGELFVTIGLGGSDAAIKGLKSVKGGFDEIIDSSIQTKAAIAGVIYGLERLTGTAGEHGMELTKFFNLTGIDLSRVQALSRAFELVGVSGTEFRSTLKGIQSGLAQVNLTGQGMQGLEYMNNALVGHGLGGLDWERLKKNDALYMENKIRQFLRLKDINPAVRNEIGKTMSLGENYIQGATVVDVTRNAARGWQIMGDTQRTTLTQVSTSWHAIWYDLGRLGDYFVETLERSLGLMTKMERGTRAFVDYSIRGMNVIAAPETAAAGARARQETAFQSLPYGQFLAYQASHFGDVIKTALADTVATFEKVGGWGASAVGAAGGAIMPNVTINQYGMDYKNADENARAITRDLSRADAQLAPAKLQTH